VGLALANLAIAGLAGWSARSAVPAGCPAAVARSCRVVDRWAADPSVAGAVAGLAGVASAQPGAASLVLAGLPGRHLAAHGLESAARRVSARKPSWKAAWVLPADRVPRGCRVRWVAVVAAARTKNTVLRAI
jgi:hypothetical protein